MGRRQIKQQKRPHRALCRSWLQDPAEIPELVGPEPVLEELSGYMVSPEFFEAWNLYPAQGGLFTPSDMEKGDPLLVLGPTWRRSSLKMADPWAAKYS